MMLAAREAEKAQSVDFQAEALTLTLPGSGFTDDEFYQFCQLNENLQIERNAKGQLIILPLSGGEAGIRNAQLSFAVAIWNRKQKKGLGFDSSTGFKIPSGATYSPDFAWVAKERWEALTDEQQEKFVPLCPDFIVEILSPSQPLSHIQTKVEEFMENGCHLGWLVDPQERVTHVFRPKVEVETVPFDQPLFGGQVLKGLKVKMADVIPPPVTEQP